MIVIEERKICRMLEGLFQFDKECEWNDAIEEAMHRFVNLPTIEAEPVRHGKWEVLFYDNIPKIAKCSECGEALFFTKEDYPIRHISNYCPNCGAKMDGGGDDGNG